MTVKLFSPITLRGVTLENRIVVSPMVQFSAEDQGNASDWHLMHLGMLAMSGAGLIITEATAVEPRGVVSAHCLGLWSDANMDALGRVIGFCRKHSPAKLGIQLQHAGRKGSVTKPWEKQVGLKAGEGGWVLRAPSAIPYPGRKEVPEAIDHAGLAELRTLYREAAQRADRIGYDVLEIHNAHGYLLHEFLSPVSNARTDEYGGSREGRMRFPLEVFSAVREVWPEHKALGVRISATDWIPGGWDCDDSVVFSQRLKDLGCDYVTASSGGIAPEQTIEVKPGYQIPFAERIRRETGIVTMGVGLITDPQQAEDILQNGQADLVALARGMLFNPRWPWLAAHMLGAEAHYAPQYERCHPSMLRGDFLKPYRDRAAAKS